MSGEIKMLLTVHLKNGRVLSGEYNYLGALVRLQWAENLPEFVDFTLTEIK